MIRAMLYATDLGVYAPFVMQHALALARTFGFEGAALEPVFTSEAMFAAIGGGGGAGAVCCAGHCQRLRFSKMRYTVARGNGKLGLVLASRDNRGKSDVQD